MTTYRELAPDLARLTPIAAGEIVASYVLSQRGQRCDFAAARTALAPIFPLEPLLGQLRQSQMVQEKAGQLVLDANGLGKDGVGVSDFSGGWDAVRHRLALRAASGRAQIGSNCDQVALIAAVLRQVYALDQLGAFPTRAEVRCQLLFRALKASSGPFAHITVPFKKPFKFDALSRSLYLALAGLTSGHIAQADWALARKGFLCKTPADLANAVLKSSVCFELPLDQPVDIRIPEAIVQEPVNKPEPQCQVFASEGDDLDAFAESVRTLAAKLETKPYAGRVAIAQVYDAGIAEGLHLGSLDAFKERLAEAAREGLLDLERYDIAGPFDMSLKERSRLRFGRDERHFIVNQWI